MLRFAPSPTGFLHMGNVRVALLNYLYAKKNNLSFFLRIDDTDQERSKKKFVDSIIDDLRWLGIDYKNYVRQSERISKYKDIFNYLKTKNFIYPCFESSEELALKRKILLKQGKPPIYDRSSLKLSTNELQSYINSGKRPHWRLKLDDKPIEWEDLVHGKITFNNLSVSDPVVFRSDEMPLFTITSVVDDADLKVSHILRGDDHITNTAAQIKLFQLIDSEIPIFGHVPLLKSLTGKDLSKRSESFSVRDCKKKKIFNIVVLNYLNKLGTSNSIEKVEEIETLINNFDLTKFSKSSVFFDSNEIERLNSKYIKDLDFEIVKENYNSEFNDFFWKIIRSNVDTIDDAQEWYNLLNQTFEIPKPIILEKNLKSLILKSVPDNVDLTFWPKWTENILKNYDIKPKNLYITLREILTGKKFGPSMNELLTLMNKDEIIKRVETNCEEKN